MKAHWRIFIGLIFALFVTTVFVLNAQKPTKDAQETDARGQEEKQAAKTARKFDENRLPIADYSAPDSADVVPRDKQKARNTISPHGKFIRIVCPTA